MRRRLVAMHEASGGRLMQERRGPRGKIRWTVSLDALKSLAPLWFSGADEEDVALLRAEVARVSRDLELAIEQIGALSRATRTG